MYNKADRVVGRVISLAVALFTGWLTFTGVRANGFDVNTFLALFFGAVTLALFVYAVGEWE